MCVFPVVCAGGGVLVLGQDQDQRGEGFNPVESFVGSLSQLHIWNYVLSSQQVISPARLRRRHPYKHLHASMPWPACSKQTCIQGCRQLWLGPWDKVV